MPDAPNPELNANAAEQLPKVDSAELSELDRASGEYPIAKAFVEKLKTEELEALNRFGEIANDSDPDAAAELSGLNIMSERTKQQINEAAARADAEMLAVSEEELTQLHAEALAAEAAEAAKIQPQPESVAAPRSDREVADAFAAAAESAKVTPPKELPKTERKEKEAAPLGKFISQLDGLMEDYKKAADKSSKSLQRKIAKMMVDAHPDKFADEPRLKEMATFLGRLSAAAGGDARAWSTPGGASLEADWQKWKGATGQPETGVFAEPAAAPETEAASTEAAAEKFNPEQVYNGFAAAATELLREKGKVSPDLMQRMTELNRQRTALKAGKGPETLVWKTHEKTAGGLSNLLDTYSSHPVGMLQSLDTFLSDNPELGQKIGITRETLDALKREKSQEVAGNPEAMRDGLGSIAADILRNKGEVTPDAAYNLKKLVEEYDFAKEYSEDRLQDAGWQQLVQGLDHLQLMTQGDDPKSRLEALRAFAQEQPEAAAKAGVTPESIQTAIDGLPVSQEAPTAETKEKPEPSRQEVANAAAVAAAESGITSENPTEIEAQQRLIEKLTNESELAFTAGNESQFSDSIGNLEKQFGLQAAVRQEKLNELLSVPAADRDQFMQAEIDGLETANWIEEKTLERRKSQLELLGLQREKKGIDTEVAAVQKELEAYAGAQKTNLLAQTAEEGRVLAAPGPDKKQDLEAQLAGLLGKQGELAEKIGATEKQIAEVEETIVALGKALKKFNDGKQYIQAGEGGDTAVEESSESGGPEEHKPSGLAGGGEAPAAKKPGMSVDDVISSVGKSALAPTEAIVSAIGKVIDPSAKGGGAH